MRYCPHDLRGEVAKVVMNEDKESCHTLSCRQRIWLKVLEWCIWQLYGATLNIILCLKLTHSPI